MDKNTITTTINIEGNITNLEKAVNEAQKSLSGLSLGKGMKESNAQMFADFKATFERMRELTEGGKLKAIDAKEFEKETERFNKLWEKLVKVTNSEGLAEKPMQKYATAIEKLKKAQDSLSDKTKDAAKKAEKAIKDQAKAVNDLADATEKREKAEKKVAAATAGKEAAKQTRNELYDKVFTKRGTTRQAASPDDIDAYNKASEDIKNYNKEIEKTNKALVDLRDKENDAKQALEAANNEVKTTSETLSKLSGSEITKITADLEKLNINWKELGIDLKSIKSSGDLEAIQQILTEKGLKEAAANVAQLASNIKTATPQVDQFNKEIRKSGDAVKELTEKQKEIENLANRIKYFFSLSSGAMLFRRVLRQTVQTITELDKVMTQTAVVTQMTVGDMWKMLPQYTERANQLGVAIKDVYEADTLYYQQGLKTNEVMAVSNETMKMARIAGLEAAEATDRMTNALRGFNMEITTANAQNINDVYSNLAAHTASNVQEISVAMTKVASLANSANMSFENTAAFLSQIIETTRESAETAGTALKTVIARFSEVKTLFSKGELMGQDEEGQEINVNKISEALRTAGINLNEYIVGAKGLDEIFMELSQKWDSLDMVQQRYIATMAAGSRQQSRFIALMQDYNRMTELTTMANNSAGASTKQFEKTLESLETLTNKLKNAWNEFLLGLLNTDLVKGIIKLLTDLLNVVNKLTNGWDNGSKSILKFFAAIGTFKIGKSLFSGLTNVLVSSAGLAGQKGSKAFADSFTQGLNKTKNLFSFSKTSRSKDLVSQEELHNVQQLNAAYQKTQKTQQDLDDLQKRGIKSKKKWNEAQAAHTASQKEYDTLLSRSNITQAEHNATLQAGLDEQDQAIVLNDKEAVSNLTDAASKGAVTTATKKETVEEAKNNAVKKKNIFTRLALFGAAIKEAFAITFSTGAHKGESKESKKTEIQNYKEGASWYYKLGPIGLVVLVITAAIAVTALLVVGIIALIKSLDKWDNKLKTLNQSLEEYKEANEAAKTSQEELQDGFDKYAELSNELSTLVQGTEEWNEALIKSNQLVLDLIEKFPSLAKYLTTNSNTGALELSQSGFDALIKEQQKAALQTQVLILSTEAEIAQTEYERDISRSKAFSKYGSRFQQDLQTEELGTLLEKYPDLKDTIDSNVDEFNKLSQAAQQAAAQQKVYTVALKNAAIQLADVDSDISPLISSLIDYGNFIPDRNQIALEASRGTYNELFVRTMGGEESGYRVNDDGKIEKKEDDEWKEYKWKDHSETIIETVQKALASDEVTKQAEKTNKKIQSYLAKNPLVDKDQITRILSGPNSWLQEDLKFIEKDFGNYENFLKEFTDNVDTESDAFLVASQAFKNNWEDTISSVRQKLSEIPDSTFDLLVKYMSTSAMSGFVSNIEKLTDTEGRYTSQTLLNNMDLLFEGIPEELQKQIASALGTIDWTDSSWATALTDIFKQGNLEPEQFQKSIDNINKLVAIVGVSLPQASNEAIKSITSFYKALQKGEQTTTKIEDEETLKLLKKSQYASKLWGDIWLDTLDSLQEAVRKVKNEQFGAVLGQAIAEANQNEVKTGLKGRGGKYLKAKQAVNNYLEENFTSKEGAYYGDLQEELDLALEKAQGNTEYSNYGAQTIEKYLYENLSTIQAFDSLEELNDYLINLGDLTQEQQDYATYQWYKQHLDQYALDFKGHIFEEDEDIAEEYKIFTDVELSENFVQLSNLIDFIKDPKKMMSASLTDLLYLTTQSDKLGLNKEDLDGVYKQIDSLLSSEKDLAYLAHEYSAENATTEQTLEVINKLLEKNATTTLVGNLKKAKEYLDLLDQLEEGTVEYEDTLKSLAVNSSLTYEWLTDTNNFNLFTEAINGSETALKSLQNTILELNGVNPDFLSDGVIDLDEMENLSQEAVDALVKSGMFDVEYELKTYDLPGTYFMPDGKGGVNKVEYTGTQSVLAAKLKGKSSGSLVNATKTAGTNSGKGETHNWLTGLDKYYNLTAAINEQLRKREKLEREYDRLLERREGTYADLKQSLLDQQASLRREIYLQKELQDGREEQLKNAAGEKIQWGEGYSTYAAIGADKYAQWDDKNHQVVINWDAIHAITDENLGGAVEAYISKLEEYADGWNETEETIEDMEDELYELNQRGKEQYLELEERVIDALVKQRQLEIDELQNISDEMNEMNSDIISNIQESIEMERQIRDNTKKEEEISDLENRLEYLRRDTSGANQVAILETQEKLEDARQQYTDQLIDQTIDQMSKDNEKAQEQREKQIELMRESLDWDQKHGFFNTQARELIEKAINEDGTLNNNSDLVKLLKSTDGFAGLSEFNQMKFIEDMIKQYKEAMVGLGNWALDQAQQKGYIEASGNSAKTKLEYKDGKWVDGSGKAYNVEWNAIKQMFDAEAQNNGPKITTNSVDDTAPPGDDPPGKPIPKSYDLVDNSNNILGHFATEAEASKELSKQQNLLAKLQQLNKEYDSLTGFGRRVDWEAHHRDELRSYNVDRPDSMPAKIKSLQPYKEAKIIPRYLSGGLNTSTGLAWLDGSTSKPEYVLNARDTQVYLTLTNLLNKLLSNSTSVSDGSTTSGDNYFNIDINVDEIGSDYDVDQLLDRIKAQIVEDASYRNVNAINLSR